MGSIHMTASQAMAMFDPGQQPPKGLATAYYDNASVTGLITKAQVESNRDARAQEYCDAEKQVWNDAPWLFLYAQQDTYGLRSRLQGFEARPDPYIVVRDWSLTS